MNKCSKCGRTHSGICGIPAGVTQGYGARVGSARPASKYGIKGKPKPKKAKTETLQELLRLAKGHLTRVTHIMIACPKELPEYTDLMDRESKLNYLIRQIEQQIAAREGGLK